LFLARQTCPSTAYFAARRAFSAQTELSTPFMEAWVRSITASRSRPDGMASRIEAGQMLAARSPHAAM